MPTPTSLIWVDVHILTQKNPAKKKKTGKEKQNREHVYKNDKLSHEIRLPFLYTRQALQHTSVKIQVPKLLNCCSHKIPESVQIKPVLFKVNILHKYDFHTCLKLQNVLPYLVSVCAVHIFCGELENSKEKLQ